MPQGESFKHGVTRRLRAAGVLLSAWGALAGASAADAQEAQSGAPEQGQVSIVSQPIVVVALPEGTVLAAAAVQSPVGALPAVMSPAAPGPALEAPGATADAAAPPPDAAALAPVETATQPSGSTGLLGLHSDITFSVLSAPRHQGADALAAYQTQVKRIAAGLEGAARGLYPDAVKRIGAFDVYVADSSDLSAMSSGTGKIAVNAGFSKAVTHCPPHQMS